MGRLASACVPPSYPMRAALTRDLLRRSIPVVRSARHPVRMVARRRRSSGRERFSHHADDLLGFLVDLVQESAVRDSGIGHEIDGYASITNEGTSDRYPVLRDQAVNFAIATIIHDHASDGAAIAG